MIQFLNIVFIIANSAGPVEMPHFAAFHLGLHCVPKYLFRRFPVYKGLIINKALLVCSKEHVLLFTQIGYG